MGLALGLVFVPCAGPILASITVLAATNGVSWGLVALTLSFSVGIAIPLLIFGMAGQTIGSRTKVVRNHLGGIRIASGVILMLTALVIATNVAEPLQRAVPGFLAAPRTASRTTQSVQDKARQPRGPRDHQPRRPHRPRDELRRVLVRPDRAAQLRPGARHSAASPRGSTPTAASRSRLDDLKGKVVLIDFWTYSLHQLPAHAPVRDGLVRQVQGRRPRRHRRPHARVRLREGRIQRQRRHQALRRRRTPLPSTTTTRRGRPTTSAIWPAHYLIDQTGMVRQVHYGEGEYGETEELIQQLLDAPATPAVAPSMAAEPDMDQTLTDGRTPETYVGYARVQSADNANLAAGQGRRLHRHRHPGARLVLVRRHVDARRRVRARRARTRRITCTSTPPTRTWCSPARAP